MTRKRSGTAANWAQDTKLRTEGAQLVDATDAEIEARAAELGVDERRLRAFVAEARRRRG